MPVRSQVGRYLLIAGAQYLMAAIVTATIPSATGRPGHCSLPRVDMPVSAIGFVLFGRGVFHAQPAEPNVTPDLP